MANSTSSCLPKWSRIINCTYLVNILGIPTVRSVGYYFIFFYFENCVMKGQNGQYASLQKHKMWPLKWSMRCSQCGPGLPRAVWAAKVSPGSSAAPYDRGQRLLEPAHLEPCLKGTGGNNLVVFFHVIVLCHVMVYYCHTEWMIDYLTPFVE